MTCLEKKKNEIVNLTLHICVYIMPLLLLFTFFLGFWKKKPSNPFCATNKSRSFLHPLSSDCSKSMQTLRGRTPQLIACCVHETNQQSDERVCMYSGGKFSKPFVFRNQRTHSHISYSATEPYRRMTEQQEWAERSPR